MDRVLELRDQGRAGGKMNLDEELESTRADDEFDEEKVNLPRGPRQNSLRGVGDSVVFIQIYARAYRALFLHRNSVLFSTMHLVPSHLIAMLINHLIPVTHPCPPCKQQQPQNEHFVMCANQKPSSTPSLSF